MFGSSAGKKITSTLCSLLIVIAILSPTGLYAIQGESVTITTGSTTLIDNSYYVDKGLTAHEVLNQHLETKALNSFHLFSHGRPGELLLDGKWHNSEKLLLWLEQANPTGKSILIYGCNFAKGKKGRAAVEYLQVALGVAVAASDDITGIDGDWDLEVGTSIDAVNITAYQYQLNETSVLEKIYRWFSSLFSSEEEQDVEPSNLPDGGDVTMTDSGASFVSSTNSTNPLMVGTCFVNGNPSDPTLTGDPTVVRFDHDGTTTTVIGTAELTGSVWGVAYSSMNNPNDRLLLGSVLRRHTGLGPGGLGAIYVIDNVNLAPTVVSEFYDFADHINVGQASVPNNAARGLTTITAPNHDSAVFDLVGKAGIGDIEVSEDGSTLYAVNLFDGLVYSISTTSAPATPPTALPAFPDPGCTNGVARPWALKESGGLLYLGVVCSAESAGGVAADLEAYVYAFNGATWTEVLNFPLNYPRQDAYPGFSGLWRPWADDITDLTPFTPSGENFFAAPTPMLSDIEFLDDGSMVVGFIDRSTMQVGARNYGTDVGNTSTLYYIVSGGEILRASADGDGTFTIENNSAAVDASFGPTAGAGTASGPGGGEFFFDDAFNDPGEEHREVSTGGLAVLEGSNLIAFFGIDPNGFDEGGVYWLDATTSAKDHAYTIYDGANNNPSGTFGKSGGIGDIEIICPACTIDTDGLASVACTGTNAITFDLTPTGTGVSASYNVSVSGGGATTISPMTGNYGVATTFTLNDNSAGGGDVTVTITDANGCMVDVTVTDPGTCSSTYSLDSTVFEDNDNNGMQDAGENGIANVMVLLYDDMGNEILVGVDGILGTADDGPGGILTGAMGNYFFQGVPAGNYVVEIPVGSFGGGEPLEDINISSTPTSTTDDETDNDDNGVQSGGAGTVTTSPVITLGEADGEPTIGEAGQGGTQDDAGDAFGDMTVDFGFFQPVSLGDTTWVDLDSNGLQDVGEPFLAGITVTLYNADGTPVVVDAEGNSYTNVTTTDGNGFYEFTNLPPGDYYVVFDISTVPGSEFFTFTTTTGGDEANDSDADPTTRQSPSTGLIPSGANFPDLDAGVVCNVTAEAGAGQTVCSTAVIDLTTLGASFTPMGVTDFGATWTSSGTGTFDDGAGEFGVATTYTPNAGDIAAGQVILTLTTDDPSMPPFNNPVCGPAMDEVIIIILDVDCGNFPWGGN